MNNKFISLLKYLLGWPFSILAFVFIVRIITPQASTIAENIKNPNNILLAISIFCFVMFYFLRSIVWHLLLKVYNADIRFRRSSYFWAASELKRYIPGNVWGFIARTFRFSEIGIDKKDLARLLLIEAGIFVVAAVIVSTLALSFIQDFVFLQITNSVKYLIWILVFLGALLYIYNFRIHSLWKKFTPKDNFQTLFMATLSTLFFGFGYYFAISAIVFLPIEYFFTLSGFFVLSFLIGALSIITPAGFGVREGSIIIGLSKIISESIAGFAALFARFILVLSELLFVLITFVFYKAKNKYILLLEKWIGSYKHETALMILFMLFTSYFTAVSFLRHDNFYTGRFDLGNMAQTVWNTTEGRVFEFTNPNGTEILSRLAFHADFILIALAPFYALFPTPKTLLFIQALIVGMGAFFVYMIALEKLKNKNLALAISFSYLIYPAMGRAVIFEFHAVVLATTFLLAAYYFYLKKKIKLLLLFLILAALTKEQIWLVTGLFGALLFIKNKLRLLGGAIFIISIGLFYYLVSVAIPNAHGSEHFALSYYADFGETPSDVIINILSSPEQVISTVFEKDRLLYIRQLFLPVGFLPVLFPLPLIFAMPDFLKNILSSNPQLYKIHFQYTAAITPFVFISSIYALKVLTKIKIQKIDVLLTIYVIITALFGAYRYSILPGSKAPNLDMFQVAENRELIRDQIKVIPQDASVAASNAIGAHFSNREVIYALPNGLESADYIVFYIKKDNKSEQAERERDQSTKLKEHAGYRLLTDDGELVVFERK